MATPAPAAPKKMGTPRPNPKKRKPDGTDGKVGQALSAKRAKKAVREKVVVKKEPGTALANRNKFIGVAADISKSLFGPASSELQLRAQVAKLTRAVKLEKAANKMMRDSAKRCKTKLYNMHADLKEERRLKNKYEEMHKQAVEKLTSINADVKKNSTKCRQALAALTEKNVKLQQDQNKQRAEIARLSDQQDKLVSALKKTKERYDKARGDVVWIYLKANRVATAQKRLEEDGNRSPAVEALNTVVADLDSVHYRLFFPYVIRD